MESTKGLHSGDEVFFLKQSGEHELFFASRVSSVLHSR